MTARPSLLSVAALGAAIIASPAFADPPDFTGRGAADAYEIIGDQTSPPTEHAPQAENSVLTSPDAPVFVEYRWVIVCMNPGSAHDMGAESDCGGAHVCSSPRQRLYRLWGRPAEGAGWQPLSTQCFGSPPTAADTPRPRITPALVLNEIRRIGLPRLQARTQPEGKTLVNFDTIFYTEAEPFSATVPLLGRRVEILAEPTEYVWHHGDGGVTRTTSPGAPYPSKEITYRYSEAHTTVRPRVDVTYRARFRVNGREWQAIPETVTITGPESTLRISEAAPVLSGDYS